MIYASRNILLVLPWVIDSKSITFFYSNYKFNVFVAYLKNKEKNFRGQWQPWFWHHCPWKWSVLMLNAFITWSIFLYPENLDLRNDIFGVLLDYLQSPDSHATVSMCIFVYCMLLILAASEFLSSKLIGCWNTLFTSSFLWFPRSWRKHFRPLRGGLCVHLSLISCSLSAMVRSSNRILIFW